MSQSSLLYDELDYIDNNDSKCTRLWLVEEDTSVHSMQHFGIMILACFSKMAWLRISLSVFSKCAIVTSLINPNSLADCCAFVDASMMTL